MKLYEYYECRVYIPTKYEWIAISSSGACRGYTKKPRIDRLNGWWGRVHEGEKICEFPSCPHWQSSLRKVSELKEVIQGGEKL